jgi:nucleoside-diphosphate-sugar epimerase
MPLKVHVTGVTGLIGDVVYAHLAAQPDRYTVTGSGRRFEGSSRVAAGRPLSCPPERFRRADLADLEAMERAFEGAEVVVHMGAIPDPSAPLEVIVPSNVVGGYNALEACRRQGVRRIVYASTVMTDWGYQFDEPYKAIREARFDAVPADFHRVTHRDAARPTEPYSASKVWGEGLCRAYADGHGLSCLCLRIGGVNKADAPQGAAGSAMWCSQRDVATVVELAVNAPTELSFDVFYALSGNRYRWLDAEHTRAVLGFEPADRAEDRL